MTITETGSPAGVPSVDVDLRTGANLVDDCGVGPNDLANVVPR